MKQFTIMWVRTPQPLSQWTLRETDPRAQLIGPLGKPLGWVEIKSTSSLSILLPKKENMWETFLNWPACNQLKALVANQQESAITLHHFHPKGGQDIFPNTKSCFIIVIRPKIFWYWIFRMFTMTFWGKIEKKPIVSAKKRDTISKAYCPSINLILSVSGRGR